MQEEYPDYRKFVYSSEMVDFVTRSNRFCEFLEQLKGMDGRSFITGAVKLLSAVYASMLTVAETEPVAEDGQEPVVTEQEWAAIYQQISILLGSHNDFLRPAGENEFDRSELVPHTISEDLADVYQELRDFTTLYSRGMEEMMNDAAWELRERFAEHWGGKALRALLALHDLYVKGVDPTEV